VPNSFALRLDALAPAAGVIGGAIYRGLLITGVLAVAVAFIGAETTGTLGCGYCCSSRDGRSNGHELGSPADFLKQFLGD